MKNQVNSLLVIIKHVPYYFTLYINQQLLYYYHNYNIYYYI